MPTSIHSESIEEVHDVPLEVIQRPLPSEVDEDKVSSIMETLQVSDTVFHFVYSLSLTFDFHAIMYFCNF
jgi:uncharacterized ParB-like nuclease family protein